MFSGSYLPVPGQLEGLGKTGAFSLRCLSQQIYIITQHISMIKNPRSIDSQKSSKIEAVLFLFFRPKLAGSIFDDETRRFSDVSFSLSWGNSCEAPESESQLEGKVFFF